jgi:aminoglycoside 6-adenylyltransferase
MDSKLVFKPEQDVFELLTRWGEQQSLVRAMLLTSSRAVPHAAVDVFSDYDVILALRDVHPFHESRAWLAAFGQVLVMYQDPLETRDGCLRSGNVVQFEDGLKIDFNLWQVELVQRVVAAAQLTDEFDAGYRVLLDKDHLTDGLKPPTYKAYIPKPPTEGRYAQVVENFFLDATYVAKLLWRDDLVAAKHLETDHNWTVKPGLYGQRLKVWLRPDLWAELEGTYTGTGLEENWEALSRSIALFRKAAVEVGERLGYTYPHDMDQRACAYLQKVKDLPREAAGG